MSVIEPKKLWSKKNGIIIALILVLAVGLVGCEGGLFSQSTETPTPVPPTETPIPTETPLPTETPRPSNTPRPTATRVLATSTPDYRFECIPFAMVDEIHLGKEVCVYGEIVKWTSEWNYAAVLRFADIGDHFLVRSVRYYWPGIEEGDCIQVSGEVQWNGTYYYIEFDKDGEGAVIGLSFQCQ